MSLLPERRTLACFWQQVFRPWCRPSRVQSLFIGESTGLRKPGLFKYGRMAQFRQRRIESGCVIDFESVKMGAGSSLVERFTDNEEVDGPIPSRPTECFQNIENSRQGPRFQSQVRPQKIDGSTFAEGKDERFQK